MNKKTMLLNVLTVCAFGVSTAVAGAIDPADQAKFNEHVGNIEIKLPENVTLTITDKSGKATHITKSGSLTLKPGLETNASNETFNIAAMPLSVKISHVTGVHPVKGLCHSILPTSNSQGETVKLNVGYNRVPVFNSVIGYDCFVEQGDGVGKTTPADMVTKLANKAAPQVEATIAQILTKLTEKGKEHLTAELNKIK